MRQIARPNSVDNELCFQQTSSSNNRAARGTAGRIPSPQLLQNDRSTLFVDRAVNTTPARQSAVSCGHDRVYLFMVEVAFTQVKAAMPTTNPKRTSAPP